MCLLLDMLGCIYMLRFGVVKKLGFCLCCRFCFEDVHIMECKSKLKHKKLSFILIIKISFIFY